MSHRAPGPNPDREVEVERNGSYDQDGKLTPFDRRPEVRHVSTRSLYLAGFVLTFLGLIFNSTTNLADVVISSSLLLIFFFLLIGVSEYMRGADTQKRVRRGEIAYDVITLLIFVPSLTAYFEVLSVNFCSLPTIGVLFFALGYIVLKSSHILQTYSTISYDTIG